MGIIVSWRQMEDLPPDWWKYIDEQSHWYMHRKMIQIPKVVSLICDTSRKNPVMIEQIHCRIVMVVVYSEKKQRAL